jgi:hypothetical protein
MLDFFLSEVPNKVRERETLALQLGVEHGKKSSPHIISVVSKPQQQGGHGPKIAQSTIEKEEEEEEGRIRRRRTECSTSVFLSKKASAFYKNVLRVN